MISDQDDKFKPLERDSNNEDDEDYWKTFEDKEAKQRAVQAEYEE